MKMQSVDMTADNIEKIGTLFPTASPKPPTKSANLTWTATVCLKIQKQMVVFIPTGIQ